MNHDRNAKPSTMPRPAAIATLLSLVVYFSGCALAPGMRYGVESPANGSLDTTGTFQGVRVSLRSLTPQVAAQAAVQSQHTSILPSQLTALKPVPYHLGLYDVVTVAVWEHPELTMPLGEYRSDLASGQMIDESGSLFYPYVGMLAAKGLTPTDLRQKLIASLSKVLNNPQLDVKVTAFRSQKVFVHGAVVHPGVVPVTDVPLTLLDAITQAGGVTPMQGDASHVELMRDGRTYTVDLFGDYGAGMGPSSLLLKDGDVLRVASREEGKVYVMGEVDKQSAVPMENGRLSLVQALAEVGGLSPLSAQSKGIYVFRLQDSANIQVFHLNARNPLALAMADRFPLLPHDVVFVDATGLARWNRAISLLTPTLSLYQSGALSAIYTKQLVP